MNRRALAVPPAAGGERLDRFLSDQLPEFSRAQIQRLIVDQHVTVDGRSVRPAERVRPGQSIEVQLPAPAPVGIVAAPIALDVVYESPDLVVIDKPAGLVVHPAPGHPNDTLANALMARYPNLAVGNAQRPGIVHRLDKGTSGLLVVALTDRAFQHLSAQMQARAVQKEYLALIYGHPTVDAGVIEAPIGRDRSDRQKMGVVPEGREARTSFQVIERLVGYSLLRLKLDTGRTHQIRVHLSAIGHPVVGDVVYGPRPPTLGLTRPFLHSWHLGFELPDGNACVTVWSPLRPDLTAVLQVLREKG